MRLSSSFPLIFPVILGLCRSSAVKRQGAVSFAGANNRYIHGVSDPQAKETWAQSLADSGARVVRVFLDSTYGCQQGSTTANVPGLEDQGVGTYDDSILDAMDSLLGILFKHGLKAIISPHNGNDLEATQDRPICDTYCQKYGGAAGFYGNTLAATAYDNRLTHILNYTSKAFPNRRWKELSEVIEGFDIQNEPFIAPSARDPSKGPVPGQSLVTSYVGGKWLCDRAATLKRALYPSAIQVLTGGIGGDDLPDASFSFIPAAVTCAYIDVIAMHEFKHAGDYGRVVFFNQTLQDLLVQNKKKVLVEEFGVGGPSFPSSDYDGITSNLNSLGLPWLYWEYVPGPDSVSSCPATGADACCTNAGSYDGYEIGPATTKPLSVDGKLTFGDRLVAASNSALNTTGMVFS